MTSLSSAPATGDGASAPSNTTASPTATIRRMELSFLPSGPQDRDAVAADERPQQQHGADDDGQDKGAERAGHAGIAVLDLVEDRHRAQVEARKDQEDDGAHRHHAVDEEIDEDRERGAGQQRQDHPYERREAAGPQAHRGLLDRRVNLLERVD